MSAIVVGTEDTSGEGEDPLVLFAGRDNKSGRVVGW